MKKIFLLGLISLIAVSSNSQSSDFKIGLKTGVNYSIIDGHNNIDYENIRNICGGINIEYSISKTISLESGLNYIKKGSQSIKYSSGSNWLTGISNTYPPLKLIWTFDYIEIPFKLKVRFFFKPRLYIGVGPHLSVLSDYKYQMYYLTNQSGIIFSGWSVNGYLEKEYVKKIDLGLSSSIGCEINLAHDIAIFTEVNLSYGLSNTNKWTAEDYNAEYREFLNLLNSLNGGAISNGGSLTITANSSPPYKYNDSVKHISYQIFVGIKLIL